MRYKRKKHINSNIDMTSLLDIIFLVLIFFIIAASFDINRSLTLDIPESFISQSDISQDKIVIEIDSNSNIVVNGEASSLETLASSIRTIDNYQNSSIYLFGDKKTNYEKIISILDILKMLGLNQISLVTDSKESF